MRPVQNVGADPRDPEAVRAMFDRVAPRYDVANHLLSGGVDYLWRARAVRTVATWQPTRILDLATGSGDVALALQRQLPDAEVTGADFSAAMLDIARRKGLTRTVTADALALPFVDGSFDCVTVAFGLRNMADWSRALSEIRRVLGNSGHLLILDFSLPSGFVRPAYRFYLHRCLPLFAALVTQQRGAYEYLGASIESFPSGHALEALLCASGFDSTTSLPLTGGIASLYTARKSRSVERRSCRL